MYTREYTDVLQPSPPLDRDSFYISLKQSIYSCPAGGWLPQGWQRVRDVMAVLAAVLGVGRND